MNAKLLERIVEYREAHGLEVTKIFLSQKVKYQYAILHKREEGKVYESELLIQHSIQDVMLVEARAARRYWTLYKEKLGEKVLWVGRKPHSKDCVNTLLDIGYHYLSNHILILCKELNLPTELGFFHKAQSKNAHPFVYDFMEWLRPIMVDQVLLKILSRKKKNIEKVDEKLVKYFVFCIKKRLNQYAYHRKLKYCIQFDYWIRLVLLECMGAIHEKRKCRPNFPSLRHESRCKKTA